MTFAQPRHGKQHPAIRRLGHHQRVIGCEEFPVYHHVYSLAGRHDGQDGTPCRLAVLLAQRIDPHPVAFTIQRARRV